jgi:hypothetical protein
VRISSLEGILKSRLVEIFTENWGSPKMVVSGVVYDCCERKSSA